MSNLEVNIEKLGEIYKEWRGNESCYDSGRPVFDADELLDFAEFCLKHEANVVKASQEKALHKHIVRLSLPLDFWQKLREQYFLSCTNKIDVQISKTPPKVNMAAHDLFEWFKNKILGNEA